MAKRPRKPTASPDQGDLFISEPAPAATRLPAVPVAAPAPLAMPASGEHGRYGVEPVCGECGGPTIIAKDYRSSATEPSHVQARCRQVACSWRGTVTAVH